MSADDKKYRAVQIIRGMLAAAGKKGVSKHLLWTELEIQGVKPTRATDLMVLVRKANARKLEEAKGILYLRCDPSRASSEKPSAPSRHGTPRG